MLVVGVVMSASKTSKYLLLDLSYLFQNWLIVDSFVLVPGLVPRNSLYRVQNCFESVSRLVNTGYWTG